MWTQKQTTNKTYNAIQNKNIKYLKMSLLMSANVSPPRSTVFLFRLLFLSLYLEFFLLVLVNHCLCTSAAAVHKLYRHKQQQWWKVTKYNFTQIWQLGTYDNSEHLWTGCQLIIVIV